MKRIYYPKSLLIGFVIVAVVSVANYRQQIDLRALLPMALVAFLIARDQIQGARQERDELRGRVRALEMATGALGKERRSEAQK